MAISHFYSWHTEQSQPAIMETRLIYFNVLKMKYCGA